MANHNNEENFKSFFTREISEGSSKAIHDGEILDITGMDGRDVVQVLTIVVNKNGATDESTSWYARETYYLKIQHRNGGVLFRLSTEPKQHHPGNGIIVMCPRGGDCCPENRKPYLTINNLLKNNYGKNTTLFAQHIQDLFLNNESIARVPEITAEVYMVLLFEIARRFVETNPFRSLLKESFDKLPISVAIAKILKLFQEDKGLLFDDVFTHQGSFHIFTGSAEKRRENIKKIHERYKKTVKNKLNDIDELTTTFGCSSEFGEDWDDWDEYHNETGPREQSSSDGTSDGSEDIEMDAERTDESDDAVDNDENSDEEESDGKETGSDESEEESDDVDDGSNESDQDSEHTDYTSESPTSDESSDTATD